jgi:hypothetical protein
MAGAKLDNRRDERDRLAKFCRSAPAPGAHVSLGKAIATKIGAQDRSTLGKTRRGSADAAMTVNLEGVRSRRWMAPSGLKRLMAKSLARRDLVSYEVTAAPPNEAAVDAAPREKRSSARRRLRLRSAKLLDAKNAFLCECLVHDQSSQGLCLKLMKNVGLPARCHLYDDETEAVSVITTIWRRGAMIGVRYNLLAAPVSLKPSDRAALRGRYYAVRD